jgi:hypothetical protein
MASYAGQKSRILTAAEAELERVEARASGPDIRVNPSSWGSGGPMAYVVAVLVLIVSGYLLFSNKWNTDMDFPSVVETVPAPDVNSTIAPSPAPPLAPQTSTSPANPPVTP